MVKFFYKQCVTLIILSFFSGKGFPQFLSNPDFGVSAVQSGMWATVNNPAGLAKVTTLNAGLYYHSPFLLKQTARSGVACSIPLGNFSILGLCYQRFGYSLYREQTVRVTIAKQLGQSVSAGVRLDCLNIGIGEGYGNATAFTGTAGLIIQVTNELLIAMSVFNPQRMKFSEKNNSRYPVIMNGGAAWQFGKHAKLSAGVKKPGNTKAILIASIEYRFSNKFLVDAGFSNGLYPVYFGYGFTFGSLHFGMHSGYHQRLGFSPQVLLSYKRN